MTLVQSSPVSPSTAVATAVPAAGAGSAAVDSKARSLRVRRKPYVCVECGMRYTEQEELNQHAGRVHDRYVPQ